MFFKSIHQYLLSEPADNRAAKIARYFFFGGLLVTTAWLVYFAGVTVTIPYPIEYREGASQVMTQILRMGGNPFTLEYQPLGMNNYGIAYGLFTFPFAALFGNTLTVHRLVTGLFIISSLILALKTISGQNLNFNLAVAGSIFIVLALTGRGGIGASPSAAGSFLFLAAILIPFNRSFDRPSLLVSALLSVLAFYTKPYFVLSFGIVASYLFLFVSKKKGLLYSLLFISMFVLSCLAVRHILKLYFINILIGNLANVRRSPDHVYSQLIELLKEFYPVLIPALTVILLGITKLKLKPPSYQVLLSRINFLSLDQPLLIGSFNYFAYFFICSTLAFVLILGGHIGNYMAYSYQIMVPPFVLWLFQQLKPRTRLAMISMPLLLFNMAFLSGLLLNPDFLSQKDSKEWAKLYEYVGSSGHILNSPVIVSAMVERGMLPVDSGQTEYFYRFNPYPKNGWLGPEYRVVKSDGRQYKNSITDSVGRVEYDRIILTEEEWLDAFIRSDLVRGYALVDTITVDMPQTGRQWTIEVWDPKVNR